ncbi:MAG TPA: peptidoglycan-associated lipoprotein Pal, partial [Candidatus Acidoferrum sp.]|nr:peptidoglycan-associated lipoprotein Pal [Candidatus Acidoferrum sp.]
TIFYFDFDKSDLHQEDRDALVYHAAELKAHPNQHIRLEGHADERGTREYNLALGERRAKSVLNFLQVNGVSPGQMETISYGEERPADPGKTEAAYAKNRRVEMVKK